MTKSFDKFIPTQAEWEDAKKVADMRAPFPKITAPTAAFMGFLGTFMATILLLDISETLGLAGLNTNHPTFAAPAYLAGAIGGLVGYFYIRTKEKAHEEVYQRVLDAHEERQRQDDTRRSPQQATYKSGGRCFASQSLTMKT